MPRQLRRGDYTVGWVCALPVELAAAKLMLDEKHEDAVRQSGDSDRNVYCMGSIAGHNVVIVCLPAGHIGNNPAAAVATEMRTAFENIRFSLMVGIGGGVPSAKADIRLGDVVVSQPQETFGGVVQYDFGRRTQNGLKRIGSLNSPPQILLSAISTMKANAMLNESTLSDHLSTLERIPTFQRHRAGPDILFKAAYDHEHGDTCEQCSIESREPRLEREAGAEVAIHYGTIASGNQVMKYAAERDRISFELGGVGCFEMEAAGLMNSFPCLVIRGISDYADTHKNQNWQAYAAGTAAAYAKELLSVIPATGVMGTRRADDAMRNGEKRCHQPSSPDNTSHKRPRTVVSSGSAEQRTVTLPIQSQKPLQTSLNDEQRKNLVDSLRFEQIDSRHMTIKQAHAKTCRWFLKSQQYLDWLDTTKLNEHHGFLWIKGKAGTGKSTLMKFALANARKAMKNHLVLSFFFNARGEDIEKSTIGTYRSLLLQLLERLPALQSVFDSFGLSTSNCTADYQWSIESLETLLGQAIQSLGDVSVVCFIDALDECDEDQVRRMIQFFGHVGDLAVSGSVRFQVCFSSRHYPYITIEHGLELVLEGQEGHSHDITSYIQTELKIGKGKTAQQIRGELQEKASGIFMWVVLVVGILNKESDRGHVHALRRKLQEIPGDLHELFRDILTRDTHNREGMILCVQWVLFAKQPLCPEQLYYAILSGVDLDAVTEWDPEEITGDVVKRFILDSSKGLAEVTKSKEQRVQFIHESVRDFLLKENGLGKIWPEFRSNFQGQSHEQLKQCCLNYINFDFMTPLKIPNYLPKASSSLASILRHRVTQAFPFLEYAVHNVLYHADTAEGAGISQADFLNSFPRPLWVKLNNLFEKHEVRRHTEYISLLYLLAELNMANLIRACGSASRCLDIGTERYGCPLFAAVAMGSEKAFEVCFESIKIQKADSNGVATVKEQQSQYKSAQRAARRNFVYSKSKGLLPNAAELGNDEVLAFLIKSEQHRANFKDSTRMTVLWWTCRNGCAMSARLLLAVDSGMVNTRDKDDKTPLLIAVEQRNLGVVEVLLDMGANVNMQGGYYGNALYAASARGDKEIATLLLDRGANVNTQGGHHGNALQAASLYGYKEIATLLLDRGADVNAQGGPDGNALYAASTRGDKEIATLLLDRGADVNAQGGLYGNALQAASFYGRKETATLLLDRGANVNAQGGHYGNALQAASARGDKEIATLLLDRGADVNAQGGYYDNALQAASARGAKEIMTLLLDRGAYAASAVGGYDIDTPPDNANS